LELNIVINQDCLTYMKTLPDNYVDLIIADPPYFNIYGEFDFVFKDQEEYLNWCKEWILECKRILKPTGTMYLWGAIGIKRGLSLPKLAIWIEENKIFEIRNWITQRNTKIRAVYKGFPQAREELLMLVKDIDLFTWNPAYTEEKNTRKDLQSNGKPRKNEFKRCTDVWIDIAEANQSSKERFKMSDGKNFPTVKAQKLCDRIIKASSNETDLVYIPFGGSGSEIVSCIKNKRNYIATEINKNYIETLINKRLDACNNDAL
jgi:site-specific DNA-methyltransferase (adenine-specific)